MEHQSKKGQLLDNSEKHPSKRKHGYFLYNTFEVNTKDIRTTPIRIVLLCSLFTLNIFRTLVSTLAAGIGFFRVGKKKNNNIKHQNNVKSVQSQQTRSEAV